MAISDSRPAWLGAGMGIRRTRLLTYSMLVASVILGAYILFQWERIPSLDQMRNRYCSYNTDDPPITKPKSPSKTVTVTATVEKTVMRTIKPSATAAPKAGAGLLSETPKPNQACIDPYRRPGYLWMDNTTEDYDTTRWIPFTTKFLEEEDPEAAAYPYNATENGDLWFDWASKPSPEYLDDANTPTNWMAVALEEARKTNEGDPSAGKLSWLNGRVVLLISDSLDRFNTQWFCLEFKNRMADEKASYTEGRGIRTTAMCKVPSLNLTIVHWHLTGMVTYNPSWWWDPPTKDHVAFEDRYENVWSPTFSRIVGKNGKGPDLVIWQSSIWDRNNLGSFAKYHYGAKHPMGNVKRHLVWDELLFFSARVKKFLKLLRERVGSDVPMMLRTVALDRLNMARDNQNYDLDRINRAIGEKLGIEPFEWARLIAGNPDLYRDSIHPGKGPSSWLWGTMLLEYLARAVGAGTEGGAREERAPYFDGWNVCHDELTQIGSNAYH